MSDMTTNRSRLRAALCLLAGMAIALPWSRAVLAQSTPIQIHTPPQQDPGVYSGRLKVDYPTPYEGMPRTHNDYIIFGLHQKKIPPRAD
jgi:hypothetical protein